MANKSLIRYFKVVKPECNYYNFMPNKVLLHIHILIIAVE